MDKIKVKTAMLIDDDEVDLLINKTIIKFSDKIIARQSAILALEYLKENEKNDDNLPDVIFLDLRMPEMNGFEFLDEYIKLPATITSKIKIFLLTSSINDVDRQNAIKYSCVSDYLVKPLSEEILKGIKFWKLFIQEINL